MKQNRTAKFFLLAFVVLFLYSQKVVAEDQTSQFNNIRSQMESLLDLAIYYNVEGYFPEGKYQMYDYPQKQKGDESSLLVQPLLFLKVKSLEDQQIYYTRKFSFERLDDGLLTIDGQYMVLPEVRLSDKWELKVMGYHALIFDSHYTYYLRMYKPVGDNYTVHDGVYYSFENVFEMEHYVSETGYIDVPSELEWRGMITDYKSLEWKSERNLTSAQQRELFHHFSSTLLRRNPENYKLFTEYVDLDQYLKCSDQSPE